MTLMRALPFLRPLEGVGPEIETFLGPEMATSDGLSNGFACIKIIKSKRQIKIRDFGSRGEERRKQRVFN
jgi:hypothetical protein